MLNRARFVGHAKTESKYVMHASGHIPFVSQSQAIAQIVGEVYEVDAQTLATLDRLEGCRVVSEQPLQFDANSWYTREEVSVRWVDGSETLSAWMYFNEHETRHAIIPTGDFADSSRFLSASDRCWYFAYGSNMDVDRMLERGAPFTQRKRGKMVDHRLVFNKVTSKYPGHGVANVVPERGFEVRGILYEVDRAGIAALDGFEGVRGGHYIRVTMPVAMGDGTAVDAFVYVAHPDRVEEGLTPHADY
ncbi:MAG: gamma-glutamylcyclotransferase, partial [Actinobacteria bacterium]|nr:gamma-glutamylcyclotransferase [Actinomycetota bacterium]